MNNKIPQDLTNAEKSIMNTIEKNRNNILNMSIYEIAKISYVSIATVSRFIKKMNFDNLMEFRSYFYHQWNGDFSFKKISVSHIKKIKDIIVTTISDMPKNIELISEMQLKTFYDAIIKSNSILSIGFGTSYLPVISLQNVLLEMNKDVMTTANVEIVLSKLKKSSLNKDLVIIFSVNMKSKVLKQIFKIINARNINAIIVTSSNIRPSKNILIVKIPSIKNDSTTIINNIYQLLVVESIKKML